MKTIRNNSNSSHRESLALKTRKDSSILKNSPLDPYNRSRRVCSKGGYWRVIRKLLLSHKILWVKLCLAPKLPLVLKRLSRQLKNNHRGLRTTQTHQTSPTWINSYLSNNKIKMIQETTNNILQRSKA